jgi:ABC transporter ATM
VLDALADLSKGRTSVFVAHRLSTAAQCDQIVVLDEGRVVEAGGWHGGSGALPAACAALARLPASPPTPHTLSAAGPSASPSQS